jgi:predicted Zn-dependent protease
MNIRDALESALDALRTPGCAGVVEVSQSDEWSATVRNEQTESVESAILASLRITAIAPEGRKMTVTSTDFNPTRVHELAHEAASTAPGPLGRVARPGRIRH